MKIDLANAVRTIHPRFNQITDLTLDDLKIIEPILRLEKYPKGSMLVTPDTDSQKFFILLTGLTKTFYILTGDREYISQFSAEGDFAAVYFDLLQKRSSSGFILALEDTIVLSTNYEKLLRDTQHSLAWVRALRTVAESRYVQMFERQNFMSLNSATSKYQYFLNKYPHLVDRLSLNQIATFLNLTPATISRVKNKSGKYKTRRG